ncbi:hypothetical protein K438DRAFT_446844 [Mycena galopus ATCC 62051]|nr:hypothetical protein K438DRAFT_446844 [Mycena galopus ATCC 62051]
MFCGCICHCKCNCQCVYPCKGDCEDSYISRSRNLVVCIDGTSNQFGPNNTNVVEICNRIVKNSSSNPQLTYYNSGIGTYARPSLYPLMYWQQALGRTFDLAFAWRFERIVQGAYRWLSDHYKPGDKIYLFGFSRGAHQVRVLAGMIKKVGLMYAGNVEQIPFAYELYSAKDDEKIPQIGDALSLSNRQMTVELDEDLAKRFKETFSRNIGVHFLGAWETVTSIGFRWREPLPEMTSCDHICFFRHALALDEHRVKFLPFYVHGGLSQSESQHIKEVWYAGSHSDVYRRWQSR